jgi:hypothetical protein
MTRGIATRFAGVWTAVTSTLLLSLLTAATTIILAIVISLVLGAESRRLAEQAVFNGEEVVDHAIVARCEMAHVAEMLRTIGRESTNEDLRESLLSYPPINTDGLDCDAIITQPFRIGNDFGLEGPDNALDGLEP